MWFDSINLFAAIEVKRIQNNYSTISFAVTMETTADFSICRFLVLISKFTTAINLLLFGQSQRSPIMSADNTEMNKRCGTSRMPGADRFLIRLCRCSWNSKILMNGLQDRHSSIATFVPFAEHLIAWFSIAFQSRCIGQIRTGQIHWLNYYMYSTVSKISFCQNCNC